MDIGISHNNPTTSFEAHMSTAYEAFAGDMHFEMDTVGARIRARRSELKWSQKRLAEEVQRVGGTLKHGSISNLETDARSPGFNFHKLAQAMGVTTSWLETGAEPKLAADAGPDGAIEPTVLVQTIVDVLTLIRDDRSFNRKLTDDEIRGLAIAIQTKASRAELKLDSTQDLTAYIDLARQARVLP